jgi:pimeloyl-ACP methyl ester carboxylesterase
MSIYENGAVRTYYEEAGSGFPLLVIPGGGLNSTIAGLSGSNTPFNPMEEFKGEYRCIAADQRNANGSSPNPFLPPRASVSFCINGDVPAALTASNTAGNSCAPLGHSCGHGRRDLLR